MATKQRGVDGCQVDLALVTAGAFISGITQGRIISTMTEHQAKHERPEWDTSGADEEGERENEPLKRLSLEQAAFHALVLRTQFLYRHFDHRDPSLVAESASVLRMALAEMERVHRDEGHLISPLGLDAFKSGIEVVARAVEACEAGTVVECDHAREARKSKWTTLLVAIAIAAFALVSFANFVVSMVRVANAP